MPDKAHKTDGTQGAAANADAAAAEAALAAARIGPDLPSARAQGPSDAAGASAGSDPLAILTAPGAEPEPDPDRKPDAQAKPEANASLFGILDADQRIRANAEQHERSLWAGAAGITLLYTAVIASQVMLGAPLTQAERERQERRGQDALPESISVELVPDPDKTAKTKKWRDGTTPAPAPAPSEQPPQPPQMAALEQPEVKDAKPTEDPAKDPTQEPREDGSPMMLDIESLVDAAAADLTRRIDRAFARKPQKQRREQQATLSGGEMKVRGSGASGKSSEFFRSVIAALMKTRPGPFALWGRVLVSFEISPSGTLNYVHLLHSSGNSALDAAAVNAIHKARFERPPPGLTRDERTYIIDYVFG